MPEFSGLQIEMRCVKCGRLPTADVVLYEMQNHMYICNRCRGEDAKRGKHIAWANGQQAEIPMAAPTVSFAPATPGASGKTSAPPGPQRTRPLTTNLPPDSLFAMLNLPLDTPASKIGAAIKQQMTVWMKKSDAPEQKQMIERLRTWKEQVQDDLAFEEYRNKLKTQARGSTGALSVGGRSVFTALEFLDACEEVREGWADGERYLRTGELRQWILFQLDNRDLAMKARYYQTWTGVSDFRALNEMLYCIVPERPFRLYAGEKWQHRNSVPSATTPAELAKLCDAHWAIGEAHLYVGSMVLWLENSCGNAELKAYFDSALARYATANQGADRGVGLELLLERVVPDLEKPHLVVEFDGNEGFCTISSWDRELEHSPIEVKVTNTTRGFTSVDLILQPRFSTGEPEWITMFSSGPVTLRGRPGDGMPQTRTITLRDLHLLRRGHTYSRNLGMTMRGAYGQHSALQEFPITLKTRWFFQGLRGILWWWGLRGGLPGLFWNGLAGMVLALIPFLLISHLMLLDAFSTAPAVVSPENILAQIKAASLLVVSPLEIYTSSYPFVLVIGAIAGFAGFWTGIGKGHKDYVEKRGASVFRKWGFWCATGFAIALFFLDRGYEVIGQMASYSSAYGQILTLAVIFYVAASVIAWLLIIVVACIIAAVRVRLEKYLRRRYAALLNPVGRA